MFNRILVICVGNICRSPVAEGLFKKLYPSKKVWSAGIAALVDKPAAEHSIQIAAQKGIDINNHRAQQVTREMLSDAELILVMEEKHIEAITFIAPEVRGKTMLLGRWQNESEIPDPFKKSQEAFSHSINLIDKAVFSWNKYF